MSKKKSKLSLSKLFPAVAAGMAILVLFVTTLSAISSMAKPQAPVNDTAVAPAINYAVQLDNPEEPKAGPANRSDSDPNVVGNIFEFITDASDDAPASPTTGQPQVVMEVMDLSLEQFAPLWQREIGRRFSNAVGVLCHGGEFIEDQWIVGSSSYGRPAQTADSLVNHFKAKYPGRTIILLACNPGHLHLCVPGVYHATDSVWCVPDREIMSNSGNSLQKLGD